MPLWNPKSKFLLLLERCDRPTLVAVLRLQNACSSESQKKETKRKRSKKSLMDGSDDPLSTLSDYEEEEADAAEDSSEDSSSSGGEEQGPRLAGYSNSLNRTGSKIGTGS